MSEPTAFPRRPVDEQKLGRRRAAQALLQSVLTKAGVERDKFEAHLESKADLQARIAQQMAQVDAQSAAMRETVRREIENWRYTVEQLKTLAPAAEPIERILLETASDISADRDLTLEAKQIAPSNNSAKFLLRATEPGAAGTVSFGFTWQNTRDRSAVVNVDGYLVLDGKCQAVAFGEPFIPGFRVCHVYMEGSLNIQELWNQPPTSPIRQGGQDAVALDFVANASGILDDTEIVTRYLFRGFDLQYRQLVVPPQGHVRIEVDCDLDCFVKDGLGQFIFHDDGQVLVPGVLIGVLP